MIVMINGSFGIGKSTVAELLKPLLGGQIYDPEWAGSIMMRLPKWVALEGRGTDDFQDIRAWRRSVSQGARLWRKATGKPIILPMTFTRHDYFAEVTGALRSFEPDLYLFCLRASLETIKQRLEKRGTPVEGWIARRIVECEAAHHDSFFGRPILTDQLDAQQVAQLIAAHVARSKQAS
jgi:predicted kinase